VLSAPHQDIPRALLLAYLLSMPIYCLVRLAGQPDWVGLSTALTAASLFAFSLTYAIAQHGLRRAVAMLVASFAIALTLEYLGSSYGILFGKYDYTDRLGPKLLGKVPAIIPIAWFMMLYPSWATAGYLLTRFRPPAMPMPAARVGIAALAMTAWDLSLDPRMVADGNWVWRAEGAIFRHPAEQLSGLVRHCGADLFRLVCDHPSRADLARRRWPDHGQQFAGLSLLADLGLYLHLVRRKRGKRDLLGWTVGGAGRVYRDGIVRRAGLV
jgi:uncharacterized membrane protein